MKHGKRLRLFFILAAMICMWSITAYADQQVYVGGTFINGIDVSGKTVEGAREMIENPDNYRLDILKKDGTQDVILGSEIGFRAAVTGDLNAILAEQNTGGRVIGPAVNHQFFVEVETSYDEAALDARILTLSCITAEGGVKTENAHISSFAEGQEFTIIEEVYGDSVDFDLTRAVILATVAEGGNTIDLNGLGCYQTVTVTADDPHLKELCDTMNRCRDMVITYVFGENQEILDGGVISSWLTGTSEDGQILVDQEKVAAYVGWLAEKYNTFGKPRILTTAVGNQVEVNGSYGWEIDQANETAALLSIIQNVQSQSREPLYTRTAADRNVDWGASYVEIDLTNQHVYMTKDGVVVWDAPCVTGDVAKGYATPAGIYTLTYKEKDRILRGTKRADGSYSYESHVDYWMPFNGGIGLHDASWRSSFGGNIFLRGGSHGCINLPRDKARLLYDLVEKGIPVICYH